MGQNHLGPNMPSADVRIAKRDGRFLPRADTPSVRFKASRSTELRCPSALHNAAPRWGDATFPAGIPTGAKLKKLTTKTA